VPPEAKAVIVVCLLRQHRAGHDFIVELQDEVVDLPPIIVLIVPEDGRVNPEELLELQRAFRMCGARDTVVQRSIGMELRLDMAMSVRRALDILQQVDAEIVACVDDHDNRRFWPCVHRVFQGLPKMNNSCSAVPAAGAKIGHYELIDRIGQGVVSDVFSATDLQTKTLYAIKVVPKSKLADLTSVSALWIEMSFLEGLSHPHILGLKDVMHAKRNFYFVMEYAGKRNLYRFLKASPRLDLAVAQTCMKQISSSVAYCHQKCVAHRDLKPENIVVMEPEEDGADTIRLKIVDFGSATSATKMCSDISGTVPFIPPEVILNESYNPTLADTWACGGVLLELIFGIGSIPHMLRWTSSPEVAVAGRQMADFFATSRNLATHVEAKLEGVDRDLLALLCGLLVSMPEERWNAEKMNTCAWLQAAGQPSEGV